jgi:hypothetical protein
VTLSTARASRSAARRHLEAAPAPAAQHRGRACAPTGAPARDPLRPAAPAALDAPRSAAAAAAPPPARAGPPLVVSLALLATFLVAAWAGAGALAPRRGAVPHAAARSGGVRPRVLVSIAAFYEPGRPVANLTRLLVEYASAPWAAAFDVRVRVDTTSAALGAALAPALAAARVPAPDITVWPLAALGGDPLRLPAMHRAAFAAAASFYDFFVYSEDDMLLPLATFSLYVVRRAALAARGWAFGFVRAEIWSADGATPVAVDNVEPVLDARVFSAPNGALYAEPWSPYAALYALDAAELRGFMADASGVWASGFPPLGARERVAVGYGFKFAGAGFDSAPYGARGWRARVLVPLTRAGAVDPAAVVFHLPSKYATHAPLGFHDVGSVKVADVFNFTGGRVPRAEALPDWPPPKRAPKPAAAR